MSSKQITSSADLTYTLQLCNWPKDLPSPSAPNTLPLAGSSRCVSLGCRRFLLYIGHGKAPWESKERPRVALTGKHRDCCWGSPSSQLPGLWAPGLTLWLHLSCLNSWNVTTWTWWLHVLLGTGAIWDVRIKIPFKWSIWTMWRVLKLFSLIVLKTLMFAGGCGGRKQVLWERVELSGTLQPLVKKAWTFSVWLLVVGALYLISFCDQFLCLGLFEGLGPTVVVCHITLMVKVTLEDCDEVWGKRLVFWISVL